MKAKHIMSNSLPVGTCSTHWLSGTTLRIQQAQRYSEYPVRERFDARRLRGLDRATQANVPRMIFRALGRTINDLPTDDGCHYLANHLSAVKGRVVRL